MPPLCKVPVLFPVCLAALLGANMLISHCAAQTSTPPAAAQSQPSDTARDLKRIPETKPMLSGAVPQSYALVIGIAHYENLPPAAQLQYPDRDAESIYTTLLSEQGGQFPADHVHLLTGAQATQANILQQLDNWLPSVTRPNDRVLIYFAGHGFISGGQAFLAPYDIDLHNIAASAIPMQTLGVLIGTRIQGKWKVLMTDACHSGAITPETNPQQLNEQLLDLHQSIFSLTASRDREQSFESPSWGGGHGIFTYYVVQGLAGAADANGDGVVTADELAEYVHTNVRAATEGRQNPTSERGSFDPNMVLAYDPAHAGSAPSPALKYGTLVVQTNMDNTELWLDGKQVGTLSKSAPLRLPGLPPGSHTVKAVHMGYQPDGPREEMIYPGQETTVDIRILIPRQRNQAAVDLLDQGVADYKKGFAANYRKAEAALTQAVAMDPNYSEAYMYLGRVEDALYEDEKASAAFERAIAIDPDYHDARVSYAAALLDQGGLDEAVRQLNAALQQQSQDGTALYLLSQAYARKSDYADGKSTALLAVKAVPANGEAHFWLAESERHLNDPVSAEAEYRQYLSLTSFNSGAAGNVNFYLAGFLLGMGSRRRAAEQDIWRQQQGQANLGICDCEWMQKRDDAAIPYCEKALALMPDDLWANYRLGLIYVEKANSAGPAGNSAQQIAGLLSQAKLRFANVIAANPDTDEAGRARQYISRIDAALSSRQ